MPKFRLHLPSLVKLLTLLEASYTCEWQKEFDFMQSIIGISFDIFTPKIFPFIQPLTQAPLQPL